ncbi:hypothetical protein BKA82DRAFT_145081, partial [Pisolithus tinctorius]
DKMSFIKVMPTVGHISKDSIKANISNSILQLHSHVSTDHPLCGVSFVIEKTALKETAVYMPTSNSVGGLCWTHSHQVDLMLNTYKSTLLANVLKEGTVHLGKEVTVAGVHLFSEDGLYPLLTAPTCKTEESADMEFIFNIVMASWQESGVVENVGPIWSFTTDGNTTCHKTGHKTFLKTQLLEFSPLYGALVNLPGLNLMTNNDEVTLKFDYKHTFKCQTCCICSCSLYH